MGEIKVIPSVSNNYGKEQPKVILPENGSAEYVMGLGKKNKNKYTSKVERCVNYIAEKAGYNSSVSNELIREASIKFNIPQRKIKNLCQ